MTGIQEELMPGLVQKDSPLPERLIEMAIKQNLDADKLGKLMELKLTWEANEARKAYIEAIQQFKATLPAISKSKHISYATSTGGKVDYWYVPLDQACSILTDALHAVGITHSWKTSDTNGKTTVACVLTHKMGHSEEAALLSGPSDTSGGKNNIQAIGSTVTYLQRYTLLAACGVAAKGQDDDGKSGEGMPEQAIEDYCVAIRDESTMEGLKKIFKEAYSKATALSDQSARGRLTTVYESRKREILGSRQ